VSVCFYGGILVHRLAIFRNAEAIRASRKAKYIPKIRLPAIGLSDEEKKLKNQQKAARWYEKSVAVRFSSLGWEI
jgi:hypothetical protein